MGYLHSYTSCCNFHTATQLDSANPKVQSRCYYMFDCYAWPNSQCEVAVGGCNSEVWHRSAAGVWASCCNLWQSVMVCLV
jgi:hypothetical protein